MRGALDRECTAVSGALARRSPADLTRPTRLVPWDVAHLVAHVYRAFERFPDALARPPAARPPEADAVSYWRAWDRDDRSTEERADLLVGQMGHDGVVPAFDAMWRRGLALLDTIDGDLVVETWGPAMRMDDYAATRLVEIVIHGLDLTDALGAAPLAAEDAAAFVGDVLRSLAPGVETRAAGWTELEWIEKASGRTALSDEERTRLGEHAALFPVLY